MSAALKKLPLVASAAVSLREASAASGPSRGPGLRRRPVEATSQARSLPQRVLLVEPDESSRSVLQVALARDGFEVVAVKSAGEALQHLSYGSLPVAVVAEVRLSGVDGFALCGQLRAEQSTAHLPVILLAQGGDAAHAEQANLVGADDFLPKPIFAKDVVSLVRLKTADRTLDGVIHADAAALPLPQLLRALLSGVRSGKIELSGGQAQLLFRQGRVIDATFGKFRGTAALMRLLVLGAGDYTVTLGPSLARATVNFGLRELVGQAFPRLLRWTGVLSRSVPIRATLQVNFAELAARLAELPDGVNEVVRLFDGRRTVRDVLIDSGLPEVLALEVITRLYSLGVIGPVTQPEEDEALLPREVPRLFEPAPDEAREQMLELFGDELPKMAGELGVQDEAPAGFDRSYFATDVSDLSAAGFAELPFRDPSPLHPEVTEGLSPELIRQLDAFRIGSVVEPLDEELPVEIGVGDLRFFAKGGVIIEADSLAQSVEQYAEPLLLTHVFEAPAAPAESVEAHFFSQPALEPPAAAQVEPVRVAAQGKPVDALGLLLAVALLSGGAGVVAWRMGEPEPLAVAAPAALAPASEFERPSAPPAPKVVVAAVLKPLELQVPGPTLEEGIALYDSGKLTEAAEALERFVEGDPASSSGWLFLGLAHFDAGNAQAAEDAAMRALELDPANGRAVILMASIYLDQKQRQKAVVELKRYLDLEPAGPFAAEARELLSQ